MTTSSVGQIYIKDSQTAASTTLTIPLLHECELFSEQCRFMFCLPLLTYYVAMFAKEAYALCLYCVNNTWLT